MQASSQQTPTVTAPPGTSGYIPGLVARARLAHPDLPMDAVILQSLLICLIAQARLPCGTSKPDRDHGSHVGLHLILRTKEEDVGLVVNLVALTLQHILGISTHKHKIPPKSVSQTPIAPVPRAKRSCNGHNTLPQQADLPSTFIRSLFFRRGLHGSFSSNRCSTPRPRSSGPDGTPRSGNIPLGGQAKSSKSPTGHVPQRSASFPAPSTDGEDDDKFFDASSLASSRRPLLANHTPSSTMRSRASKGRPGAHRLRTDPLPLSSLFAPPEDAESEDVAQAAHASADGIRAQNSVPVSERTNDSGTTAAPSALPKAVVVSGLEHTNVPSQRALMRALTERRIIFDGYNEDETDFSERDPDADDGVWNLPDGFLMIYVCKADPHERPPVLRGLLDKFSMSADISLLPSTRQSYLAYRASHSPTPRGTPNPSPLALPNTVHSFFPTPAPAHYSPARRTTPLPTPTPQTPPVLPFSELTQLRTLARAYPTAAPIFYPSVHATFHIQTLERLPPRPSPHASLHPSLSTYLLDLFAATRHHPALDGTLLTMRAHADAEALARAYRVLNGDTVGAALVYHEARLSDRETAAESGDGGSWADGDVAWRSEESLGGHPNGNGDANGNGNDIGARSGEGEYGLGDARGIRLRVEDDDGGRSFSGGFDALFEEPGAGMSPAERLDAGLAGLWPEVWDVSEEDVARIFPRVVSHRLRVRDGPDDEILGSVMWPAVPRELGGGAEVQVRRGEGVRLGWERKSVKEILVRILADV